MAEITPNDAAPSGSGPARIVDRRILPAGVMPKQLQQWVILGIAVVMMLILALAGPPKPSRSSTPQLPGLPPVVDPNAERIADYTRRVQEQAQRLAAEQAQLQITKESLSQPHATAVSGRATVNDPDTVDRATTVSGGGSSGDRRDTSERGRVADSLAYSRPSRAQSVSMATVPLPEASDAVRADGSVDASTAAALRVLASVAAGSDPRTAHSAIGDSPRSAAASSADAAPLSGSRPISVVPAPAASAVATQAFVPSIRLSEGTVIDTVLTNRLDGTFKGPVNTMVSVPVYSGDRLVIAAGSRVLGEATPVSTFGQRRLVVAFHRVLLPSGERIDLDAFPGLNQAGDLGLNDQVNRHYGEMFGASIALGMLAGFTQNQTSVGYEATADDRYRQGIASSFGQSGTRILDRFLNLLPTVTIREGHRIKVYLSRDLDVPLIPSTTSNQGGR